MGDKDPGNQTPASVQPAHNDPLHYQKDLHDLSSTITISKLQSTRFENFAFEPVSLPASRVTSRSSGVETPQSQSHGPGLPSSKPASSVSSKSSPPLTPAASRSKELKATGSAGSPLAKLHVDTSIVTPESYSQDLPTASEYPSNDSRRSLHSSATSTPTEQPDPKSQSQSTSVTDFSQQNKVADIDDSSSSVPRIEDDLLVEPDHGNRGKSPAPGSRSPFRGSITPVGEPDDPYARNKRPAQSKNLDVIDRRFVFNARDTRKSQGIGSILPRSGAGSSDVKSPEEHRRHSSIFGGKKHEHAGDHGGKTAGSMGELKRFFKFGASKHKDRQGKSPAGSNRASRVGSIASKPKAQVDTMPFADDHALHSTYGKFGKALGAGAGGSVRVMKRSSDGVTFAVKQFRARHSYESEKEYSKKVTAEFCIGSTLHHGNIIETMDIIQEKGSWFEIMELAPFDLFAGVMTGKMAREEVFCSFIQIINGLSYLHSMGLAHRDMKLDNVVVNSRGIMKIIDFGSAVVFQYPFENEIVLANGIVGSDPYLAPEVYDVRHYDPRMVDIWSLGIIFCCMSLRRFPWKQPRTTDKSYRLFVTKPDPVKRPSELASAIRSDAPRPLETVALKFPLVSEPGSITPTDGKTQAQTGGQSNGEHHHHHHHHRDDQDRQPTKVEPTAEPLPQNIDKASVQASGGLNISTQSPQQTVEVKGPWRLLRLLPRESRHIIGRMLEVDPKKRATLEEIATDPWVIAGEVCIQEDNGTIFSPDGHDHTLVPVGGDTETG